MDKEPQPSQQIISSFEQACADLDPYGNTRLAGWTETEFGSFFAVMENDNLIIFEIVKPPDEQPFPVKQKVEILENGFITTFNLYWNDDLFAEGYFFDIPGSYNNLCIQKPY